MQLNPSKHTETHYWITLFWCAFGGLLLGGIVVITYWIRRCRTLAAKSPRQRSKARSRSLLSAAAGNSSSNTSNTCNSSNTCSSSSSSNIRSYRSQYSPQYRKSSPDHNHRRRRRRMLQCIN